MKKSYLLTFITVTLLVLASFTTSHVLANTETANQSSASQSKQVQSNNTSIFVKEKLKVAYSQSNELNALAHLEKNKNEIGIMNVQESLELNDIQSDDLGMTHVRFHQTKNGVKVEGAEVIVHFNEDDQLTSVNGNHNPEIEMATLDTTPSITKEKAVQAAANSVKAPRDMEYEPITELVIYPFEGKNLLTYKVNVTFLGDNPGNWFVYVDAKNGNIVDKYNTIAHASEGEFHESVGVGVHGEQRKLHTSKIKPPKQGVQFILSDESHEGLEGIYTYDYNTGELAINDSASWIDEYHHPAVDAHYHSELVYQYYLEEHGRNSLDDNGMPIISYVNYGTDFNNAFWNGRNMTYGNGDGDYMVPLSAGLDVAAHEMTHGVITNTANLQYRFESGALNEAFADIFGALVDDENWEIGEDIMGPGAIANGKESLRSLSDPSKYPVAEEYVPYGNGDGMYPAHMDEFYDLPLHLDNGGVHINSSIINHAAYLTAQDIGREKLGQIYYRALVSYLTPTSNFSDARQALIQSAEDLYGEGSEEALATAEAYNQVGILE